MYTIIDTDDKTIEEFIYWDDLIFHITNSYQLFTMSIYNAGKNYITISTSCETAESPKLYITGLSQLEIEYFNEKTE